MKADWTKSIIRPGRTNRRASSLNQSTSSDSHTVWLQLSGFSKFGEKKKPGFKIHKSSELNQGTKEKLITSNTMAEIKRPKTAAQRLRELIADKSKIVNCPGVYDGLTARLALREGFDCLYMVSESSPGCCLNSSLFQFANHLWLSQRPEQAQQRQDLACLI